MKVLHCSALIILVSGCGTEAKQDVSDQGTPQSRQDVSDQGTPQSRQDVSDQETPEAGQDLSDQGTPEDSFAKLQRAVSKRDWKAVWALHSPTSAEKVEEAWRESKALGKSTEGWGVVEWLARHLDEPEPVVAELSVEELFIKSMDVPELAQHVTWVVGAALLEKECEGDGCTLYVSRDGEAACLLFLREGNSWYVWVAPGFGLEVWRRWRSEKHSTEIEKIKRDLPKIWKAAISINLQTGVTPKTLAECKGDAPNALKVIPKDPWGNDYVYEFDINRRVLIKCLGADNAEGGDGENNDFVYPARHPHNGNRVIKRLGAHDESSDFLPPKD